MHLFPLLLPRSNQSSRRSSTPRCSAISNASPISLVLPSCHRALPMLPHELMDQGMVLAVVMADLAVVVMDHRLHLAAATTIMSSMVLPLLQINMADRIIPAVKYATRSAILQTTAGIGMMKILFRITGWQAWRPLLRVPIPTVILTPVPLTISSVNMSGLQLMTATMVVNRSERLMGKVWTLNTLVIQFYPLLFVPFI
jgi:hypothetical protein